MDCLHAESLTVTVDDTHTVSGLLLAPERARACYVLAHGAGAGMFHPFMAAVARELGQRGIATLRSRAPNGRMLPSLRKRRFGLLWRKRRDSCPRFPLSPAANPSAAA